MAPLTQELRMAPRQASPNAPRASAYFRHTLAREAVALALCVLVPPALSTLTELPLDLFSLPLTLSLVCASFGDLAMVIARPRRVAYQRLRATAGLACVVLGVNELWDRIVDPVLVLFGVSPGAVSVSWVPLAAPMSGYDALPSFAVAGAVLIASGWFMDFVNTRDRAARRVASSSLPTTPHAIVPARCVHLSGRSAPSSQEVAL